MDDLKDFVHSRFHRVLAADRNNELKKRDQAAIDS